jgi:CHAT domain-containing protein/Tfp pilus assembly protein PilF
MFSEDSTGQAEEKLHADNFARAAAWLQRQGDARKALELYERALEIYRRVGSQRDIGLALTGVGSLLRDLGQFREALTVLEDAVAVRKEAGDRVGAARTEVGLALVYASTGNYEPCRRLLDDALLVAREYSDARLEMEALCNLGVLFLNQGALREAEQPLDRACQLARANGDSHVESHCLVDLGIVAGTRNRWKLSLAYFQAALALTRSYGNPSGEATALCHIANVDIAIGNLEDAIRCLQDAAAIQERLGDEASRAMTLSTLGSLLVQWGDPNSAAPLLLKALETIQASGNPHWEGTILHNVALCFLQSGDAEHAREIFERARQMKVAHDPHTLAITLVGLGGTYRNLGRMDNAFQTLQEALDLAESLEDANDAAIARLNLGILCEERGDVEQAYDMYLRCVDDLADLRGHADVDPIAFTLPGRFDAMEAINCLLAAVADLRGRGQFGDGRVREAFDILERGRARGFVNYLCAGSELMEDQQTGPEAEQEAIANFRLQAALRSLHTPGRTPSEVEELIRERDAADAEVRRSRAASRARILEDHPAMYVAAISLSEAQERLLDPQTLILQYRLGDRGSALWAISQSACSLCCLPCEAEIRTKVLAIEEGLRAWPGESDRGLLDDLGRELYQMLIEPARSLLPSRSDGGGEHQQGRLIVIPDGILEQLPFEVLVRGPADGGGYLTEDYAVVYAPSVTVLDRIRMQRAAGRAASWKKRFVGFAPVDFKFRRALPMTETELTRIAQLFPPEDVDLYLRSDAMKGKALKLKSGECRYLHFATHGELDREHPHLSGLLLAAEDRDTVLHAYEIIDRHLGADLVVASSCESGLGGGGRAEGMMGLSRAFLGSGCASACVSLWNVEDQSTAEMMFGFYRGLIESGMAKDRALRAAKLMMIRESPWAHPHHWGAFVLVGDWESGD